MKRFALLIAALALSACAVNASVQTDIQADATAAAQAATALGRTQDVSCFNSIGTLAGVAKTVKGPAVLTTTELGLGAQTLVQGPCASIVGAVALSVLQHTPIIVPAPVP